MDFYKIPVGFGMALVRNPNAFNAYCAMTDLQKQAIVEKARSAKTEKEMYEIISSITR